VTKNVEINLFNIYVLLLDESISGYKLEKEVGISRTTLLKVRANKEKFLSLSINTLVKIQEWLSSNKGKAYLLSPANDYNLRVMDDLDLGACNFCKKINLAEVEEVIFNPLIKTQLLKEFAGLSSMERSLIKRGKKSILSMTLRKITKIQSLSNEINKKGLSQVINDCA
jgi:hypothetical protein